MKQHYVARDDMLKGEFEEGDVVHAIGLDIDDKYKESLNPFDAIEEPPVTHHNEKSNWFQTFFGETKGQGFDSGKDWTSEWDPKVGKDESDEDDESQPNMFEQINELKKKQLARHQRRRHHPAKPQYSIAKYWCRQNGEGSNEAPGLHGPL
jgi:hypothetical protein